MPVAKAGVRPTTYKLYEGTAKRYLTPTDKLGKSKLGKLRSDGLESFLAELRESGIGARTCQVVHQLLYMILNSALRHNHIEKNPMIAVRKPKASTKDQHILTLAEAKTLLDAARKKDASDDLDCDEVQSRGYFPLILLALTAGMREGELFALQWNEVNFDQRTVKVTHTLTKDEDGHLVRSEPKTDENYRLNLSGRRNNPGFARSQEETADSGIHRTAGYIGQQVFTSPEGTFIDKDAFRRRVFQPLLTAAELPAVTFHSLRHVANSLLAANGVPLKVLQARLGHSTSRTTFDTYSHIYEESQREATQTLGRLFKGVSA